MGHNAAKHIQRYDVRYAAASLVDGIQKILKEDC